MPCEKAETHVHGQSSAQSVFLALRRRTAGPSGPTGRLPRESTGTCRRWTDWQQRAPQRCLYQRSKDLATNLTPQDGEHAQPCGLSERARGVRACRRGNSSRGNWLGVNRERAACSQSAPSPQLLAGCKGKTWTCLRCGPSSLPLRHCGPDPPTSCLLPSRGDGVGSELEGKPQPKAGVESVMRLLAAMGTAKSKAQRAG